MSEAEKNQNNEHGFGAGLDFEKYDCPICGNEEIKHAGHPDTECFDCYANRSGLPI